MLTGKSGSRTEALQQLAEVRAEALQMKDAYLEAQAHSAQNALQPVHSIR